MKRSAKEPLKYFLERITPIGALARIHRNRQLRKKLVKWEKAGATGAMPNYGKQQLVIDYIRRFSPSAFIETGTYKGKMVYAVMPYINEIYSIELDETLYRNAHKRFIGYPNIHILHGQSGEVLPGLLNNINNGCLFWLDAHYSSGSTAKAELETPIMQELECILNHPKATEHVILIDDACCFTGKDDYPTIDTLKRFVSGIYPDWTFEVKNDIIRTHAR